VEFAPPSLACDIDPSLVAKVVRVVSRQNGLRREDVADLESNVWLKLLNHEQRALRSFADRCTLFHYLKVVATRVLLDMRAASLGKWRPTSAARRAGGDMIQLERLVHRDGLAAQSAVRATAIRTGICAGDLERHLERSTPRRRPRPVALDADVVATIADTRECADAFVTAHERGAAGRHSGKVLQRAIRALSVEERRLLHLRYVDHMRIADIARLLSLDAKQLYRKLERLHARLREDLSGAGVSRSSAADIVGRPEVYVTRVFEERSC
jgi:RNA polymerase sigma factor (sigma-70 family)